jgi:hypothetical protein
VDLCKEEKKWRFFMKKLVLLIVLIALVSLASGNLLINEINPRAPEFVEIYNPNNLLINLSEWNIKDNSTDLPDNITCHTIDNCSLITNATYFLIIGRTTNISEITHENITYFYVDDSNIGNGLTDAGDNITFYNSSFSTSFWYNFSSANKSLQYCSGNLTENNPTPSYANNCTIPSSPVNTTNTTCSISSTCGSWSSCINSSQTRTCTNTSSSCTNTSYTQNQSCTNTSSSIDLDMSFSGNMRNKAEFEITLEAQDLEDMRYDVRVWLVPEDDNDELKSEIYDNETEDWKSSNYYVNKFFRGDGDKSGIVKIKLEEEYENYTGSAYVYFRLRESESTDVIKTVNSTIEIINGSEEEMDEEETSEESDSQELSLISIENNKTENIKTPKKESYKSKTEYIKEYAPYGFSLLCIILIGLVLADNNWKNNHGKQED